MTIDSTHWPGKLDHLFNKYFIHGRGHANFIELLISQNESSNDTELWWFGPSQGSLIKLFSQNIKGPQRLKNYW